MTLAKQIERITKLASIDRTMAQKEADIAMRSAPSTRAANALRAAVAALGLDTTIRYL